MLVRSQVITIMQKKYNNCMESNNKNRIKVVGKKVSLTHLVKIKKKKTMIKTIMIKKIMKINSKLLIQSNLSLLLKINKILL